MAADVSPMDVLSHLPVMCEDVSIPYVFVPSKTELGIASNTKRPTSCLMITPKPASDYMKYYDEVYSKAKATLLSA
jgi:H/ACA ribonucleoprotein complex subunit 2